MRAESRHQYAPAPPGVMQVSITWSGCLNRRNVLSRNMKCSPAMNGCCWPFPAGKIHWRFGTCFGGWGTTWMDCISIWVLTGSLDYSNLSQRYAQQFADERNLELINVNIPEKYGESIPEIAQRTRRGQDKTCSICGLVKRHIFNQSARDGNYDAVITAHNLDDEAAVLLSNSLDWSLERLGRGQPLLPAGSGFVRKAKPFCRFYERESAAYTLLRGIAYIHEECPLLHWQQAVIFQARSQPLGRPHARNQAAFLSQLLDRIGRRRLSPTPGKSGGIGSTALSDLRPTHHHR